MGMGAKHIGNYWEIRVVELKMIYVYHWQGVVECTISMWVCVRIKCP